VLGAALGGERAALPDAVERRRNCSTRFRSLKNCAIPCVLVVSMRGEFADFNPCRCRWAGITEAGAQAVRLSVPSHRNEADVEPPRPPACRMAFGRPQKPGGVLLSQRMAIAPARKAIDRGRRRWFRAFLHNRGGLLVVAPASARDL